MKTTKWKTGVLCAVLACSVLTGCGETSEDVAGTVTSGVNKENEAAASTAAETGTTTEAAEEETTGEETESETAAERAFSLGSEEGTVYENSYGGFGAAFGDGWELYSAEELQDLTDDVYEMLEDSGIGTEGVEGVNILDMRAENEDTLQSVNVNFTKMSAAEQAVYPAYTEEEIVDELVAMDWSSYYAASGLSLESVEKVSVTFLGETHFAMQAVATQYGVTTYTTQIYDFSRGSWYSCITAASYYEDTTQEVLDMFYAVEE